MGLNKVCLFNGHFPVLLRRGMAGLCAGLYFCLKTGVVGTLNTSDILDNWEETMALVDNYTQIFSAHFLTLYSHFVHYINHNLFSFTS